MESLGEKLKTAREGKGYSFEHVGRETNIARRYLEALEEEDFSPFPGEPYIQGFLCNYSEYLGLDSKELLGLYRALRIQEQPVPVEALLVKQRSGFPKALIVIFIILGIAALGAGAYYGIKRIPQRESPAPEAQRRRPAEYVLETNSLERRFYAGDSILIPIGNEKYKVELVSLDDRVELSMPRGNILLDLGNESTVDLSGNGIDEIRITVSDFMRNDPAKGGLIRFELANPEIAAGSGAGAAAQTGAPVPVSQAQESAAPAPSSVIFSSPNPYPFTLQATFTGYCMFRWESDRRTREEIYFNRADVQNIQAQNGIRIWASNASAVRLQVIGSGRTVNLDVGGPGEVVVADVRWVRNDEGRFNLALVKLD